MTKAEGNMKALLVGEGEGPGGDILLQLEAAISRGDHRYAATIIIITITIIIIIITIITGTRPPSPRSSPS